MNIPESRMLLLKHLQWFLVLKLQKIIFMGLVTYKHLQSHLNESIEKFKMMT